MNSPRSQHSGVRVRLTAAGPDVRDIALGLAPMAGIPPGLLAELLASDGYDMVLSSWADADQLAAFARSLGAYADLVAVPHADEDPLQELGALYSDEGAESDPTTVPLPPQEETAPSHRPVVIFRALRNNSRVG